MEEKIFDSTTVLSPEQNADGEEPKPEKNAADESILASIKKLLGISEECTGFDTDIIVHINTVLAALNQIGAGSEDGFAVSDASAKWSDFLGGNSRLNLVKSYVYVRVRLLFDPPASSAVLDSLKRAADELEWRISILEGGEKSSS